jgi:hypothetical protein
MSRNKPNYSVIRLISFWRVFLKSYYVLSIWRRFGMFIAFGFFWQRVKFYQVKIVYFIQLLNAEILGMEFNAFHRFFDYYLFLARSCKSLKSRYHDLGRSIHHQIRCPVFSQSSERCGIWYWRYRIRNPKMLNRSNPIGI